MFARKRIQFPQYFPEPGWVEHDAEEIWNSQWETLRQLVSRNGIKPGDIAALGITNQRETVVAWDRLTGKPLADFVRESIVDPHTYVEPGCPNVMPTNFKATIQPQQLDVLVQYLVKNGSKATAHKGCGG